MAKPEKFDEVDTAAGPESEDVRWEKVFTVRAAIAEGSYRVSAQALAEKLVERMRDGREVLGYFPGFDGTKGLDGQRG